MRHVTRVLQPGWKMLGVALLAICLGACASRQPTVAQGLAQFDDGDIKGALSTLTTLAQLGDPKAQQVLGVMYLNGQGVEKNPQQALTWFRQAAASGNEAAPYQLGLMYATGAGVARDGVQALKWYRLAAQRGQPNAQYQLGTMSLAGTGMPQDAGIALQWFTLAASQGDPQSQYQLGSMLVNGQGTARDLVLGYMWIDIARGLEEPAAIKAAQTLSSTISAQTLALAEKMSHQCIIQSYQDCAKIARPALP